MQCELRKPSFSKRRSITYEIDKEGENMQGKACKNQNPKKSIVQIPWFGKVN
jgi:hypothetical protein